MGVSVAVGFPDSPSVGISVAVGLGLLLVTVGLSSVGVSSDVLLHPATTTAVAVEMNVRLFTKTRSEAQEINTALAREVSDSIVTAIPSSRINTGERNGTNFQGIDEVGNRPKPFVPVTESV